MSAFLNAGCRWQRAFAGRVVATLVGVFLLLSGCTDGDAVSPGELGKAGFGLALDPSFSIGAAPVASVRAWVIESTGQRHGPFTQAVTPDENPISMPVSFDVSGPVTVTVEIELLNAAGGVEYSARFGPLEVRPGEAPTEATVEPHPGPLDYLDLTNITISGTAQLLEGDTTHLRVDADGRPNLQAHWRSLDETIARVDANGIVTTLQPGSARIVAMAGPVEDTITLTIGARLARIELTPSTTTLNSIGAVTQFQVRGFDSRNAEVPVPALNWTVEPATVATATGTPGEFRAVANGEATVRATVAGGTIAATATLIVEQTVAIVTVTPGFASLTEIGATADFSARAADANGNEMSNVAITWSSSDSDVATVDANGRATAVSPGTTTIVATTGGISSGADLIVAEPVGKSSITGKIRNTVSDTVFPGAQVTLFQNSVAIATMTARTNGSYEFTELFGGEYEVRATANGYAEAVRQVSLGDDANVVVDLELSPLDQMSSITGTVRSALDGAPVVGALVQLYPAVSHMMSSVQHSEGWPSTTTRTDGTYEITNVPADHPWLVRVTAQGYSQTTRYIELEAGQPQVVNFALSPVLVQGQFRIVLTWNAEPEDLDSHLFVPSPPTHVFYGNQGDSLGDPYASLDIDDTDSFGPETITIWQLGSGVYEYMVHDWTNSGESESPFLSQSGARVEVYGSEGLITTFEVPGGTGTLWRVFRIVNGAIVPVNTLSDDSPFPEDAFPEEFNVNTRPMVGEKPRVPKKPRVR